MLGRKMTFSAVAYSKNSTIRVSGDNGSKSGDACTVFQSFVKGDTFKIKDTKYFVLSLRRECAI